MAIYLRELAMDLFWTVVVILLILWLLGFFAGVGELIHILLVIAVIIVVYRLATGRNVATGK
jgi:multisubunit Na+/H+ antiporter MnhF subunit